MMFRHAALAPWARRCRQALGALLTVTLAGLASAQAEHAADSAAHATTLPATVRAALAAAQLPPEALAVLVLPAEAPEQAPRLAWQIHQPMNPASVMKLVTTLAALDLLGPAYTWQTPVYLDGTLQGGVLRGNVYVQGQGDPQLVAERLWLLLQRLQAQGVQAIEGDIVLDRSAFPLGAHDPAAFDGEPLRPYNAAPDALLINYQTLTLSFVPDVAAGVARIAWLPPLAQWSAPESVPLAEPGTPCGEWQQALQPQWPEDLLTGYGAQTPRAPLRLRLAGRYPAACGERQWSVAVVPQQFAARAVEGMWRAVGGRLSGQVREGRVPAGLAPAFSTSSPPLAEVVRNINKFSNNVMTQQLLLTLGREQGTGGDFDSARQVLQRWWHQRLGAPAPVVDNGAGLSREARITAAQLGRLLQQAWALPVMPEFMASLPIAGVDGTLRRQQSRATGRAHLKTGSLRDVMAQAGYVTTAPGRRWVVVALVNHPNAGAARPVLQALLDWVVLAEGTPASAVPAERPERLTRAKPP